MRASILMLGLALSTGEFVDAGEIKELGAVTIDRLLDHSEQLSGIARIHGLHIVCPDEQSSLYILKANGDDELTLEGSSKPLLEGNDELDMEGLASEGDLLYVLGSHCLNRRKPNPGSTKQQNLKRYTEVDPKNKRDHLFRLKLDASGNVLESDDINLRKMIIGKEPFLAPFCNIPSKENGFDLEGIACRDGVLHIGCRGPVLLDDFVPVLRLKFDNPSKYEVKLIHLDGFGIRDMAAVRDGFLILAGPTRDVAGEYRLYHWSGEDGFPGTAGTAPPTDLIGVIPVPEKQAKAEGLLVISETGESYELMVLYDGAKNGGLRRFSVKK